MRSIRLHLIRWILIAGGGVLLIGNLVLFWVVRDKQRADFDSLLEERGRNLANLVEWSPHEEHYEIEYVPETGFTEVVAFRLFNEEGRIVDQWGEMPTALPSPFLAHSTGHFSTIHIAAEARSLRVFSLEFRARLEPEHTSPDDALPLLRLQLARDLTAVTHFERYLATAFLIATALSLCCIIWVSRGVVTFGLKPLEGLGRHAAQLDPSRALAPFPATEWKEIAPLAERLNALMVRVEETVTRERRFSASVSHDLRTPIAELRSIAEVALRRERSPAELRRAIEESRIIAFEMENLTTRLLEFLQAEQTGTFDPPVAIDFKALIAAQFHALESLATRRELRIESTGPDSLHLHSTAAPLEQIVRTLVQNALTHAPAGTIIRSELSRNESGSVIWVLRNEQEGLDDADLPHLFEPFWRKQPERSERAHAGLGLSLAHAASLALGARLEVQLKASEIIFELTLPRISTDSATPPTPA
jgi:two-component system sensor histidine kinase QseC